MNTPTGSPMKFGPRRGPAARGPLDDGCNSLPSTLMRISFQVVLAALLAALVTFAICNFYMGSQLEQGRQQQAQAAAQLADDPQVPKHVQQQPPLAPQPRSPLPAAAFRHPFKDTHTGLYTLEVPDTSERCKQAKICDGDYSCGEDGLGCVRDSKARKEHIRNAIRWSWLGYKKNAWGYDEANVASHSPSAWFDLGLTIVDSIDTLLVAGLLPEYQEARHWVANHLHFPDGSTVQFFEVNIRIMGGLLSAYYLSGGDELYLHKADQLVTRLSAAYHTTSGMPVSQVRLDKSGQAGATYDSSTNLAEAGTMSLEFTTAGRLLGREHLSEKGMLFWYDLVGMKNFSGLYCQGISTAHGECQNPTMTIGSAADSMYEYMLKQWVLSNKTQELPLQLYKGAMAGMRKYLVRDVFDGRADMSIVSEATGNVATGTIGHTNDRFEHLTCFVGGMLVLGALHNVSTQGSDDLDDIELGARIGRACYELYHQAPSGVGMDSVYWRERGGGTLAHGPRWAGDKWWKPRDFGRRKPAAQEAVAPTTHSEAASSPASGNSDSGQGGKEASGQQVSPEQQPQQVQQQQQQRRRLMQVEDATGGDSTAQQQQQQQQIQSGATQQQQQQQEAQQGGPTGSGEHAGAQAAGTTQQAEGQADAAGAGSSGGSSSSAEGSPVEAVEPSSSPSPPPSPPPPSPPPPSPPPPSPPPPPPSPPPPAVPATAVMQPATREDFLRPEAAETLFYLWRATGDSVYREWGWSMFRAWEKYCKQDDGGYVTARDVFQVPAARNTKMESFWLAETLKYLFLLFEDDANVLPLDQWVFNTEAHPLPVWGTEPDLKALKRLKQRAAEEAAAAQLKKEEEEAGVTGYYPRLNRKIIASGGDAQGYGFGKVVEA